MYIVFGGKTTATCTSPGYVTSACTPRRQHGAQTGAAAPPPTPTPPAGALRARRRGSADLPKLLKFHYGHARRPIKKILPCSPWRPRRAQKRRGTEPVRGGAGECRRLAAAAASGASVSAMPSVEIPHCT